MSATHVVLGVDEIENGQLKAVKAGDLDILLVKADGNLYAIGATCPHYGAKLEGGLLCGHRLTCPWHKAAFDVTTGAVLDPPAIDNVPSYAVSVADGKISVTIPASSNDKKPVKASGGKRHFVVLGSGAAGLAAAQAFRDFGFDGHISLVSNEPDLPYDRTALSKEFLSAQAKEEDLAMRPDTFYQDLEIDRVIGHVTDVATDQKLVEFDDGRSLSYDSLLVATGGIPKSLEIPGAGLGNIFVLRSLADARKILEAARPGVRTVVIGGSFISLEVASCFALRKLPVMVIAPEKAPFAHTFGPEVGRALGHWHEGHGVEFRLGLSVERIAGTGVVREVVLTSGERILADLIVVGSGVRPATDALHGVSLLEDGSLEVDQFLNAVPDVYAAGDIASYPDKYSGKRVRIEHWRVAEQHGRTAAANMLGHQQPFTSVPYFWTNHFGTRFDYVGHAEQWQDVIVDGDLTKPEFMAYYVNDDRVLAVSACGRDREVAALEQLYLQDRMPTAAEVKKGIDLIATAAC